MGKIMNCDGKLPIQQVLYSSTKYLVWTNKINLIEIHYFHVLSNIDLHVLEYSKNNFNQILKLILKRPILIQKIKSIINVLTKLSEEMNIQIF
jgi:hypothetical protein